MKKSDIKFYKKVYITFGDTFTCSDIGDNVNLMSEYSKYNVIHPDTFSHHGYAIRDDENLTYTFTSKFIDIISK